MKTNTNTILIIFGIMALCVLALFPISVLAMPLLHPDQKPDPQATVQAMVTQTMISLTLNAPMQTQPPPTVTPDSVTQVATPTSTQLPAVTYCDWASFVKDVTIPDGTTLLPGETFTKVWRLKNRGTCTWTPDYMLVFSSGSQMGGTTAIRLPGYVAPGQTIDISVTLTAPSTNGSYTGYWMLRNSSGALFGTGDKANIAFYVDIKVIDKAVTHGTINGSLCYPSEYNPAMTLYVEDVHTGDQIQFAIAEKQLTYSVLVPTGRYYIYAWAPDYKLEGAYTHANGLMKSVFVPAGQTVTSIHLCDWTPHGHGRGE
jgi:hypothetical protein